MDIVNDERLADLPCGEKASTRHDDGLREMGYVCIFKAGHHGLHYSKLSWNDAEFWWGEGPRLTQERVLWTA